MEKGGAGDGGADGGNGLGAFALAADIAAMKLLEKRQEQDAGGGGGGGGDGAPAPAGAAATRDPDPAAAAKKKKKQQAPPRPMRKATQKLKPMAAVGAKVMRLDDDGTWEGGYEVTAVHTGNRTMDLKHKWGREYKGVARDDVLIDAAEAAAKRAEIVAYVAAHGLGATLGAMFANDEDEGDIMDPRTCTTLNLDDKDLSAAGAMPPAAALQRLTEVKKVDLTRATLPANGLEDVLAGCPHLTWLNLDSAKFDRCEGGFPAVVDQIAEAPIGTEHPLDLHLGGVTALRAGDVFSRLIAGCPRLRVLCRTATSRLSRTSSAPRAASWRCCTRAPTSGWRAPFRRRSARCPSCGCCTCTATRG